MFSKLAYTVFERSIADYHKYDNVDQPISNPYSKDQFEHLLYHKNWIDTVQWHFEDIIRDPQIDLREEGQWVRTNPGICQGSLDEQGEC